MAVVTAPEAEKVMAPEGILKVGWILKSSGGKKASDGAELVRIVEDWQQRLFTLGRDLEGTPMLCWYKNVEQYKKRKKPQNSLTLEKCRAEIVQSGDMTAGAVLEVSTRPSLDTTLDTPIGCPSCTKQMPCLTRLLAGAQDDPSSPTPDASTLRKSQMGLSVNAKQFVVITPKRNLKCEIVDANDSAQEWVDVINSIAIDGAIARSGSKKFSLMRRSDPPMTGAASLLLR